MDYPVLLRATARLEQLIRGGSTADVSFVCLFQFIAGGKEQEGTIIAVGFWASDCMVFFFAVFWIQLVSHAPSSCSLSKERFTLFDNTGLPDLLTPPPQSEWKEGSPKIDRSSKPAQESLSWLQMSQQQQQPKTVKGRKSCPWGLVPNSPSLIYHLN